MAFAVFHAKTFDHALEKFPNDFKTWLEKIEDQLQENPCVGDPIRVPWFREKKLGKYRVYCLIYDDIQTVYLVGISDKNDQQRVINTIWFLIDAFKHEIRKLVNR